MISSVSEALYKSIFETMGEGLAVHEIICNQAGIPVDYRFLEVNHAFETLTGLEREKIIGKTVREVLPDTEDYWIETYGDVALNRRMVNFENYHRSIGKYFEVTAFSPKQGQFVTIFSDVTDRKQVSERQLKQLEEMQALLTISQMLAGVIDLQATLQQIADSAGSLIKKAHRTILHLLDESEHILSAVAVSGMGRPQSDYRMNFKPGEGIAGIVLASGQTINVRDVISDPRYIFLPGRHLPQARSLLVAPVRTPERSLGTLSVQSPLPDVFSPDDERLLTTLGAQAALAIDKARLLDELQNSLQHEKAARAQLVQAEKLAALGRIVASVAHELNNPMQAIQNALYLVMQEAEELTPQTREDLQTVLNETDRMADLITRLRATYRPSTVEEFRLESLNFLVDEVQKLLAVHLRRNQISFEFEPDPDLPLIQIIRDQIKQVILNICLNAVEAMTDGGLLKVSTVYDTAKKNIALSIFNTGSHISPEILANMFEPFMTTKEGGTGLGLSISYDIVQQHGGSIEVTSLPGQGTTFTVILPATR